MIFGLWATIKTATVGDGVASAKFAISVVFVMLGAGRVWFGLRV